MRTSTRTVLLAASLTLIAACQAKRDKLTAADSALIKSVEPVSNDSGAGERPVPGKPPAGASAEMVTLGDRIFHGEAAQGTCYTCHGIDARGTPMAPSLADSIWFTGNGTYDFIQQRVRDGMASPTAPYVSPMLPMGGVNLTPEQIRAVAAYVYAISHH